MKSTFGKGILAAFLLLGLTACGSNQSSASVHTPSTTKTAMVKGQSVKWQVYKGINWSKKDKGVDIGVDQISVSQNVPNFELGGQKTAAVKVQIHIQNHSSKTIHVNPDGAILVIPENIPLKTAASLSSDFKGEIKPGQSETGTLGFYLKPNTKLSQVNWVNLKLKFTKEPISRSKEQKIETGKIKIRPE